MKKLDINKDAIDVDELVDEVAKSRRPIRVHAQDLNAILISEDHWNAIRETLNLLQIPGMRRSIKQAMKEPLAESSVRKPFKFPN